ncbi:MAG: helix-turn-helix domain-containing protein [Actinomycetota bacterium]
MEKKTLAGDAPGAERPSPDLLEPDHEAVARALSHASRRRIAGVLSDTPGGLTVFEIAERVGLHHNAVRQHLAQLASAGLVSSEREAPRGRGRPRIRYRMIDSGAQVEAGHRELVRLLVSLLRVAGIGPEDLESFGREQGRRLAADHADGPSAVFATFARLGFAPRETTTAAERAGGMVAASLEHCPFRDAVVYPGGDSVCRLHRGLARGLLDVADPGGNVVDLEVRDPVVAGCRLVIARGEGGPAGPPAPAA